MLVPLNLSMLASLQLTEGTHNALFDELLEAATDGNGDIHIVEEMSISEGAGVEIIYAEAYVGRKATPADCDDEKKKKKGVGKLLRDDEPQPVSNKASARQTSISNDLPENVLARITYNEAQAADLMNRNRRVYAHEDALEAAEYANALAEAGSLFILGGHPAKGVPAAASDTAGLGRWVKYNEGTGKTALQFDLIDGPEGRAALSILRAGGALPISSRSTAKSVRVTTKYEGKFASYGTQEVAESSSKEQPFLVLRGYKYKGWDIVPGVQSVRGATTRRVEHTESHTESEAPEEVISEAAEPRGLSMNLKELKSKHPDTYKALLEEAVQAQDAANARLLEMSEEKIELVEKARDENSERITELENELKEMGDKFAAYKAKMKAKGKDDEDEDEDGEEMSPKMKEMALELKRLRAADRARSVGTAVDKRIKESKYVDYLQPLKTTIINENHVPASAEEGEKNVEHMEKLVSVVLGIHHKRMTKMRGGVITESATEDNSAAGVETGSNGTVHTEAHNAPGKIVNFSEFYGDGEEDEFAEGY